jgi:hypothetical protein
MSRIYLVTDDDFGQYLVRANHPTQAVGILAKEKYKAKVASQDDLVSLIAMGKHVIEDRKSAEDGIHE